MSLENFVLNQLQDLVLSGKTRNEKWNSGEMPLTEANTMCSLKFEHN